MIAITAHGYCPRQPELRVINENFCKCEFEVLFKRPFKDQGQWATSFESVTFYAVNEDAKYLAESLFVGRNLSVTGVQETQRWETNGQKHKRVVYRVTHFHLERNERPNEGTGNGEGSYGAPRQQASQPQRHSPPQQSMAPRYASQQATPPSRPTPPPSNGQKPAANSGGFAPGGDSPEGLIQY